MSGQLRVLLVSGVFPPKPGGPSAQTAFMARALARRNVDVHVITYGEERLSGPVDGVTVTYVDNRVGGRGISGKVRRFRLLVSRVGRAMDAFSPGVVHAQTGGPIGLATALVARRRGVPCILKYTADLAWEKTNRDRLVGAGSGLRGRDRVRERVYGAAQRILFRLASRIWATTPAFADRLAGEGVCTEKIILLPNFIELSAFGVGGPARAAERPEGLTLMTVARLKPWKGVDTCIKALALLAELPVRLRVVGSGTPQYEAELRELARSAGVAERVEFAGLVPSDQVAAEYAEADLFVLASHYEPFGIVLLEAMAAGLPVVATRVGGIPDVVQDGVSGVLVPPGDPVRLADALRALLLDPARRGALGRGAVARAARFDGEECVARLLDEYRALVPAFAARVA